MQKTTIFFVIAILFSFCSSSSRSESKPEIANDSLSVSTPNAVAKQEVETLEELRAAINNAKKGDTIWVSGRIETPTVIKVRNKEHIALIAYPRAELISTSPTAFVVQIENCQNVTVQGFTMNHNVDFECIAGVIEISNSSSIFILDNDISGCGSYGVFAYNDCESIILRDNEIHDCTYNGIEIHAMNTTVIDNIFYNNGDMGASDMDISPPEVMDAAIIRANRHLGVNWDKYLKKLIETLKGEKVRTVELTEDKGLTSITGYFIVTDLLKIEYEFEEDNIEKATVYLKDGLPVFCEASYTNLSNQDSNETQAQAQENIKIWFLHSYPVTYELTDQNGNAFLPEGTEAKYEKVGELLTQIEYWIEYLKNS